MSAPTETDRVKPSSATRRTLERLERLVEHRELPFRGVLERLLFHQVLGSEIEGVDGEEEEGPPGQKDD